MINYWAILVCGVLSIVLGSIWYGPLFGKAWATYLKVTPEQMKNYPKSLMIRAYVLSLLGALFTAFTLGNILTYGGALTVGQGAIAGTMNWLGFMVPVIMSDALWGSKPWKIFWMNAGYYFIYMVLSGMILVAWH